MSLFSGVGGEGHWMRYARLAGNRHLVRRSSKPCSHGGLPGNTDRTRGFLMRISITWPKAQDMTLEKYLKAVVFKWAGG
jgi:hypothetical protein